ncbi:hypothetical protein J1614_001932 [Plenodomus biglobosus]|nr:hypothetical protein J1614_001932 [Plenodomus biglobosus]
MTSPTHPPSLLPPARPTQRGPPPASGTRIRTGTGPTGPQHHLQCRCQAEQMAIRVGPTLPPGRPSMPARPPPASHKSSGASLYQLAIIIDIRITIHEHDIFPRLHEMGLTLPAARPPVANMVYYS